LNVSCLLARKNLHVVGGLALQMPHWHYQLDAMRLVVAVVVADCWPGCLLDVIVLTAASDRPEG